MKKYQTNSYSPDPICHKTIEMNNIQMTKIFQYIFKHSPIHSATGAVYSGWMRKGTESTK